MANSATTRQGLPSPVVDGQDINNRASKYGDLYALALAGAKMHPLVDEGSYYTAVNATAGTAILDTASLTGFVTTTPTMTVFNNNPVGSKSLYLDFFRLNVVAPGASGTNWNWAMYLDTGNRYSSGGTTGITAVNANMLSAASSGAIVSFGAITATAAVSQRKIVAQPARTVIKVAGDEYLWKFGETSVPCPGMPLEGTLQLARQFAAPPIVVPPQCTFLFYEWGASQATAASFEFGLGWFER